MMLQNTNPKPTYTQEWTAYNQAQRNEKSKLQELLYQLCQLIDEPQQTMGRPRAPLADIIFAACVKIYSGLSGRRNHTDLEEALRRGYLSKPLHYNTLSKYLEREDLTPVIKELIVESSLPLKAVELDFAVDSSGFSTGRYDRWVDAKWGNTRKLYGDTRKPVVNTKDWLKAHVMCGVKTNIITSVEITDAHAGDSPQFKPLVDATARNFKLREVSADKAYLSNDNMRAVVRHEALPFIAFKSNSSINKGNSYVWKHMFHYYSYNQQQFMRHYHKRSNVETTFSMIKSKFGERLRSKTTTAQVNELLCKILCHNLCCLIQSMYELGIEADFSDE